MITKFTTGSKTLNMAQVNYLEKETSFSKKRISELKAKEKEEKLDPLNITKKLSEEEIQQLNEIKKLPGKSVKDSDDKFEKAIHSTIKVRGYFRTNLYQKGYGSIENKLDKKRLILKEWRTIINKSAIKKSSKYVGVRPIILSPNPKKMSLLSREIQTNFLNELVEKSMRNFQRKFLEKGDQVGYMYSIHDDKKHLHAHIYLIPFSKKGQYISMNAPKYFRGKDIKDSPVKFKGTPTKNSKAIWMKEHNSNLFKSLVRDYSKSNASIFKGFFLDDSLTFGKRKKDLDLER